MGRTGTTRTVTWTLAAITAATVALTLWQDTRHPIGAWAWLPATVLVATLAAWPFLNGWRPLRLPARELRSCGGCGAQWRPADEGGRTTCPVCT